MRRLAPLVLLAACGTKGSGAAPADAATSADSLTSADAVDPWAGQPPAICRAKTSTWKPGMPTFTDVTEAVGLTGVAGIRLSTADLSGDLFPDLTVRHMAMGQRDTFEPGKRILTLLQNGGKAGAWTFSDVTQASGITATRDGKDGRAAHIVVFGDVDNDGDLDVFAGNSIPPDPTKDGFPQDSSELMLNDGHGHFALTKDQTFGNAKLRRQLSSASFTDYDRDGLLDLFLGYTTWTGDVPVQNPLLAGDGLGGFTDVTAQEGLSTKPYTKIADIESGAAHRNTWGTAACDLDDDGLPDLLTVSYGRYFNGFWLNGQGADGTTPRFVDAKDSSHLDRDDDDDWTTNWNAQCWCHDNPGDAECDKVPKPVVDCVQLKKAFSGGYRWNHPTDRKPYRLGGNTGTAVCADLDRDGDLDLVETTITHPDVGSSSDPSRIVRNDGQHPPVFTHLHGDETGLQHTFPGQPDDVGDMTAGVLDFDGDGRLDILVASSDYPGTHAMLFHQRSDGTFEEVPVPEGIDHKHAHGVAIADFDRDGDLDVVMGHSLSRCNLSPDECQKTEQVHAFRNDFATPGNWLELRLVGGTGTNRAAIGARVTVKAGGQTQTFEVGGGYGHYGMQQDPVLHVGLGASCEVDEVRVRWPDAAGTTEVWTHVRLNYLAQLTQGQPLPAYPLWVAKP